jgi:hypothetical protein
MSLDRLASPCPWPPLLARATPFGLSVLSEGGPTHTHAHHYPLFMRVGTLICKAPTCSVRTPKKTRSATASRSSSGTLRPNGRNSSSWCSTCPSATCARACSASADGHLCQGMQRVSDRARACEWGRVLSTSRTRQQTATIVFKVGSRHRITIHAYMHAGHPSSVSGSCRNRPDSMLLRQYRSLSSTSAFTQLPRQAAAYLDMYASDVAAITGQSAHSVLPHSTGGAVEKQATLPHRDDSHDGQCAKGAGEDNAARLLQRQQHSNEERLVAQL